MKPTLTLLTALLMISLAVPHAADAKSTKPNILFIYTDDQRWDAIGYVNPLVKTPNLDGLSAKWYPVQAGIHSPSGLLTFTSHSFDGALCHGARGIRLLHQHLPEATVTLNEQQLPPSSATSANWRNDSMPTRNHPTTP